MLNAARQRRRRRLPGQVFFPSETSAVIGLQSSRPNSPTPMISARRLPPGWTSAHTNRFGPLHVIGAVSMMPSVAAS